MDTKGFCQFQIIINGHYKYVHSYSAGIDFSRHSMTSTVTDVILWRSYSAGRDYRRHTMTTKVDPCTVSVNHPLYFHTLWSYLGHTFIYNTSDLCSTLWYKLMMVISKQAWHSDVTVLFERLRLFSTNLTLLMAKPGIQVYFKIILLPTNLTNLECEVPICVCSYINGIFLVFSQPLCFHTLWPYSGRPMWSRLV